jgi:hypothetical protein
MNKIPVGQTISGAYEFAFAGFLSVLGITWFPYLVLLAFAAAVVFALEPGLPGHILRGEFDVPLLIEIARIYGLIGLAALVVRAMVTVGLQKKVLGTLEGPTFFYFSLGSPVWILLGAYILVIIALIFILALTACVVGAIAFAAIHYVANFGYAIAVVAGIVGLCWYIYACVRLTFFLPAVVVAEGHLGLVRSWELGSGNFWRIFAVLFVVFVPVAIGLGMLQRAVLAPLVLPPHFADELRNMTPEHIGTFYMSIAKAFLQQMHQALPFVIVFNVIQSIIFLGLGNGAIGKAYLAVTRKGAD